VTYSDPEIEEIKRTVPLWKIAANRLGHFQKESGEWSFTCPWHKNGQERTPSLKVYTKDSIWLYTCFACGETGNAIQFLQKTDHLSFQDAVAKLKLDIDGEATFHPVLDTDEKALSFPIARLAPAEAALEKSADALKWLAARGITLETARRFHIGFVQSAAAVKAAHPNVEDGWVLIPTLNNAEDTITLLKYRSIAPNADGPWLRKKGMVTTLFNLQTVTAFDDVFLVEGPFDAMILAQAGYTAVALDSAQYNPTPAERDRLLQANTIYLAGDSDTPGQQAMDKLWSEFRDRTFKLSWPQGAKDANEFFLKVCGGNVEKFREEIEGLKQQAHEQPMPFIYNLSDTMKRIGAASPLDDPARLRFPWPEIDNWTAIAPGDVMMLSASDTGTGKSTWLMNVLLHNAIEYGRTVVNYSAEMSPLQYARRAAAYLAHADRDHISEDDVKRALARMGRARFYNGYKPGATYKDAIELLKWAVRRLGADITVIDPLPFLIRGVRNQFEAEGEAMRLLKDFAVEYHRIVIVISQPRKSLPTQKNREMMGQDIGGNYQQNTDSSQIFLLHRDRQPATIGNDTIFSNETKVKLEKSRESGTRVTKLFFEGKTATFWPHHVFRN
jgi:hypothetical protein